MAHGSALWRNVTRRTQVEGDLDEELQACRRSSGLKVLPDQAVGRFSGALVVR
jgi:hypothetical protein